MSKIWYLSPSCQEGNLGVGDYGSEAKQMYLLMEEITPHLDRAGVSFHVADRETPITKRCRESNEMGAIFHFALHSNAGGGGEGPWACGDLLQRIGSASALTLSGGLNLCPKFMAISGYQARIRTRTVSLWR